MTPAVEAVRVPAHSAPPGSPRPSSCATFTLGSSWGRAATGKEGLASMHAGSLQSCPTLCDPGDCARLLCQGGGFSRQEYWCVLAKTDCNTLLEHYISCCPSSQPPEYLVLPDSATQAAAWPAPLGLTGANPSPPEQPQEQTPVDDPQAEVGIKPQWKPRGSVTKEEDPKPSHQLYKQRIKYT